MIDWEKHIQPLLVGSFTKSSTTQSDVESLVESILTNSKNILEHDSMHECFFSSFVALVGCYFSNSFAEVSNYLTDDFVAASKILMEFCLKRLRTFDVQCAVPQKNLMQLISSLCVGENKFSKGDIITFTAMLKSATLPMIVKKSSGSEEQPAKPSEKRQDLMTQMSLTFQLYGTGMLPLSTASDKVDVKVIAERNIVSLKKLTAQNSLLSIYLNLPYLKRYINRENDFVLGNPLILPSTQLAAITVRNGLGPLSSNINIILQIISLPLMEPLNKEKIENLSRLALSCFYAGLSVTAAMTVLSESKSQSATASTTGKISKEPDYKSIADSIVNDIIKIYEGVSDLLSSKRISSHYLSNFRLLSANILAQGLETIFGPVEKKLSEGKATEKKQQPINRLTLTLSSVLTDILNFLILDCSLEYEEEKEEDATESGSVLNIHAVADGIKRFSCLTDKSNVLKLLSNVVHLSFEFVYSAKCLSKPETTKVLKDVPLGDDSGASEDDTYEFESSEELFSSSGDEEEGNGSFGFSGGPLLGEWFLRILEGRTELEVVSSVPPSQSSDARSPRIFNLPEKLIIQVESSEIFMLEMENVIVNCSKIIRLIDSGFVSATCGVIKTYVKRSMTADIIYKLASVVQYIRKIPLELLGGCPVLPFLHSLITSDLLTEELQIVILQAHDIVDPAKQIVASPTSLSLLFKILFQNQLQSKSKDKDYHGVTEFMQQIVDFLKNEQADVEKILEVKVEVVQMCLVLFHTLTKTSQRSFFKSLYAALESCTDTSMVPLSSSRLLSMFEYLLHYYSEPCSLLLEHVQHNLLTMHLEDPQACQKKFENVKTLDELNLHMKKYTPFKHDDQLLQNVQVFRKLVNKQQEESKDGSPKHTVPVHNEVFYDLTYSDEDNVEIDPAIYKVIKECGLDYDAVYTTIFYSLEAGRKSVRMPSVDLREKPEDIKAQITNVLLLQFNSVLAKLLINYNFRIVFRMLKNLSPPESLLFVIQEDISTFTSTPIQVLMSLVMLTKLNEKEGNSKMKLFLQLVKLATIYLEKSFLPLEDKEDILHPSSFPPIMDVMILDCLLSEIHYSLWSEERKLDLEEELEMDLPSILLKALTYVGKLCRSYILHSSKTPESELGPYNLIMQTNLTNLSVTDTSTADIPALPEAIRNQLQDWDACDREKVFGSDPVSHTTDNVLHQYLKSMNDRDPFSTALKYVAASLCLVQKELSSLFKSSVSVPTAAKCLIPLQTDVVLMKFCNEYAADLKCFDVAPDSQLYKETLCYHIVRQIYNLIVIHDSKDTYAIAYLTYLEQLLWQEDSSSIKRALYQFFIGSKEKKTTSKVDPKVESKKPFYNGIDLGYTGDFVIFLLSCSSRTTERFSNALFSLVAKICEASIGPDADPHLVAIASEMNQLLDVPPDLLQDWISNFSLIIESEPKAESSRVTGDVLLKLSRIITHPDSPIDHSLALLILQSSAVIPTENLKKDSVDVFLTILMTLAEGKQGQGHLDLFKTSLNWLKACRAELFATNYRELTNENENIVTTCELILFYIMDVLLVLHGVKGEDGYESDLGSDLEEESIIHEEEINREMEQYDVTSAETERADSEALWNKLCTYTTTQKEFMNQHWYHCYTCDMTERTGVCSICAKVCHKGHDLSYAKYGSFFCDCGARGAKACKALTKRSPVIEDPAPSASSSETTVDPSASSSANSLPAAKNSATQASTAANKPQDVAKAGKNKRKHKRSKLCKVLDGCREQLLDYLKTDVGREKTFGFLLEVISDLEKIVLSEEYRSMTFHTNAHAITTMKNLHTLEKEAKIVDNLMVPTLGSQEGAFENVKPNFTGEQGQTIRQLINTRMIFRVSMCCLSSGLGQRHHLAISHEKTKLTILQLSALLKQADANKRRLTLTTLSTTQMPFSIVTLSSNPCNEEVLALCGLKDCHIMTLTSSGIVNDHLVLHPQLSTGNYIIKAVWLPGSQCGIALITADFVKIYDLATEILAPVYYFLLPTGKIRDATFVVLNNGSESVTYLIVMSSSGYMYTQQLYADCSAAHGPFYVTNALSVSDDSLKEKNGQVGNGGISVYYSHALQLLFFSYAIGKNFAATLDTELEQATKLFNIPYKNSNGKSNGNGTTALYAWHEVTGHPGLISCFSHSTGAPVALMIDPIHIHLQEIKSTTAKAKIQDIVAVRHSSSDDAERSTIIALCEDGSLRIYLVNQETTGFWLSPNLQPVSVFNRGHVHSGKDSDSLSESSKNKDQDQGNVTEPVFPIDFFESCQLINATDLDFGGETLLQVYNPSQIRNRLNNQGMYIVSKGMYSMEITNKNKNMVLTGIRLQVGNKGSDSAPTHIYIGERYISLGMRLKKPRWFDMPMTRQESIKFSNKLTIMFGCSVHPDDYNIVDSVKLYGKTKEVFGWQEEDTKAAASASETQTKTKGKSLPPGGKIQEKPEETKVVASQRSDFADSPRDKLLLACLASLNCCFSDIKREKLTDDMKTKALCLASNLIVKPLHLTIHSQVKQLMMNLMDDKEGYHKFKDLTMLKNTFKCLKTYKEKQVAVKPDPKGKRSDEVPILCADEFQSMLVELSGISIRRPSNLSMIENYLKEVEDVVVIDLESENTQDKEVTASEVSLSDYYCTSLQDLMKILMKFIKEKPRHRFLSPSCLPGITHIESTVKSFIDVVHAAAMTIPSVVDMAADIFFMLLTSEQLLISSATRSSLVRLLRPLSHQSETRITRSNSKSTDTAPSTRSNSPPATISNQIVVTASSGSELMSSSNQYPEGYRQACSFIEGPQEGMNEDLEDEDDDSDAEYEEIGGDEGPLDEDEIMMQEGIASSLNRDEQLIAMQEMEESQAQAVVPAQVHNQDSQNEQSQENSQVQSGFRRLQDLMEAADSHSYFLDANASLEDMIMDVQDEDFASFEGDDEAMVELAIALSLQQSGGGSGGQQQHMQPQQHQEHQQHLQQGNGNQSSEQIASQVLNELVQEAVVDEATIPSTQNDDPTNPDVSEVPPPSQTTQEQPSSSKEFTRKEWVNVTRSDVGYVINSSSSSPTNDSVFSADKIESMRVALIERFLKRMKDIVLLEKGERSIPYFQVLFLFTNCLNPEKEEEKTLLEKVVLALIEDLVDTEDNDAVRDPSTRSPRKEIVINQLRCLMLLLSNHREDEKDKHAKQARDEGASQPDIKDDEDVSKIAGAGRKTTGSPIQDAISIASITANILIGKGIHATCFRVLVDLLNDYWDVIWQESKKEPVVETKLLKPTSEHNIPNFSPLVFSHYVKAHGDDVFKAYPELLTEGLLRLMYRIKKFCDQNPNLISLPSEDWLTDISSNFTNILANYMLHATDIPVIKKEVRKILLYMCGSKESYRKFRDSRALSYYFNFITETWDTLETSSRTGIVNFPYDELISIVAYLDQSLVIAQQRTVSWQTFCHSELKICMEFLLKLSLSVNETVSSTILQLLICSVSTKSKQTKRENKVVKEGRVENSDKGAEKASKQENETMSTVKPSMVEIAEKASVSGDVTLGAELCCRFLQEVDEDVLRMFLLRFLLEINTSAVRWNAHEFVHQLFHNTNVELRTKLVNVLWQLWPVMPDFGHKAVQFVDLLGYLSIRNGLDPGKSQLYTDAAFGMLRKQNNLLTNHPNSMLYMQLANFVSFNGYYLEINPCLVCNQPEVPFTTIKLASIKSDTKYTTTQHIIKLTGSHKIQRVTIKITDIKQTKMIRKASLYYNNKKVPAIIELKNKPKLWHKAKHVTLNQGQTEIRFDLPLPAVATNLMIEFSEFYENVSATTETLQCPRCSASVQANPGICGNCGENVFQCHKCRSINYDEKDPFLCNVCGFSKYAKFDISLLAKPCCAVDTIENEEDRKKAVSEMTLLLDKADSDYHSTIAHKNALDEILFRIEKLTTEPLQLVPVRDATNATARVPVMSNANQAITLASGQGAVTSSASNVNVHIQKLAREYCVNTKETFENLSKNIKTILASRKEIIDYDQRQKLSLGDVGEEPVEKQRGQLKTMSLLGKGSKTCYGCAVASAKQCIVLLRGLATDETSRRRLVDKGLITELVQVSLRRGNAETRKQVQGLIGQLVKNDPEASAELNNILLSRITSSMLHHNHDLFPSSVFAEMNLLISILGIQDNCWQLRLRTVVQLFHLSVKMQSPAIIENVTLPCLKILRSKAAPAVPEVTSKLIAAAKNSQEVTLDARAWLTCNQEHGFESWKAKKIKMLISAPSDENRTKTETRETYLAEKYVRKWLRYIERKKLARKKAKDISANLTHNWLRQMLFCRSSVTVREVACMIVTSIAENKSRKAKILDLLTSYLDELGNAGEASSEFVTLYTNLFEDTQWKVYLAKQDILPQICKLIQVEISNLLEMEESTVFLDLQQGKALKELTDILSEFVKGLHIPQHYKGKLVGTVLNSYLSLRKLVIQRTSLIDDAQDILLGMLEDMTSGTESETKAFMAVCIETINKYEMSDIKTPRFIFERLSNIIFPEENNTNEFFLYLEKDPLQEDFLQGRMVGNPYCSNEPGLGPLMRDVKNKICRDSDLVALLEDDNGMELLVNNKIISLDLPVRDVYNKVWFPNHGEVAAMRVVYRMRGLLGEATEDIIEKLDSKVDERDEEEVYKMSSVLIECGGVEVMLQRLEAIQNLAHGRQLADSVLKLMLYVVKLKENRKYLMKPGLNTLNVLLGTLNLGLQSGEEGVPLVEQLLKVMDRVLQEAAADDKTQTFTGDKEKLTLLLQQIDSELVRSHSKVLRGLMRIIPFLSFGDPDLMQMLIDHFKSSLDLEKFDESHTAEDAVYLDCFCEISTGIQDNPSGYQLKDLIIENQVVANSLAYVSRHVPQHKKFESDDWKQFVSRPALTYCLRLLAGLSAKHSPTQTLIGQTSIPDLHRLEQVSTQESIGSLAENVLEAISENEDVAKNVKEVRKETRAEKKRLAMAVRQKELGALGMKTNAKGQVVTQTPLLKQIGDLVEESGLTCIICREGYKFEPKKVLGIYTYSKRCVLEEFENKPRKQQGYTTVSHFNVVHNDCHTAAVRAARGREEWESAMLQNTNTKCNGLLPLWGPHVPESGFATCLARHNTYLQDAIGCKEPEVTSTVHDLKHLLLRFAHERSFSEEAGGGGPQSNVHLLPYMIHMAQYVINTTRSSSREEKSVADFLIEEEEKWTESSYDVNGPLYITALSLFVCDTTKWRASRITFLKRLIVLCQARQSSASMITKLQDRVVKPYETYKPFLLFWLMVDLIYEELFKHAPTPEANETWSSTLANYIRHHDSVLLETAEKMVTKFQKDYIPVSSLEEFADVASIYEEIGSSMEEFIKKLLESLPN